MIDPVYLDYMKAGVETNMVVFDGEGEPGKLCRLFETMAEVAKENDIQIDHIYVPVGDDIRYVREYYLNVLRGSFPQGREHLVIGIGPLHGNKRVDEGKDDRQVLLGCY